MLRYLQATRKEGPHECELGRRCSCPFFPKSFLDLIAAEGAPFNAHCTHGEKGYVLRVAGHTPPPLHSGFVDVGRRIEEMDAQNVSAHVLSLTVPMVYWADAALSDKLSKAFNDAAIAAHQAHPNRLFSFPVLPMHHPALAVAELERIARAPGVKGVYMTTWIAGRDLSDEAFLPVYERLEDIGLPIFLHPVDVLAPERLEAFFLDNLLGNPFDTAVAAAHLIFGRVLDRFPRLVVCLPHAGGALPFVIGRIESGWETRPDLRHIALPPTDYLRRFYYDTISYSAPALRYLIDLVGADRVMMGSDYCFKLGYDRPVEVVTHRPQMTDQEKKMVLRGNAERLVGLSN